VVVGLEESPSLRRAVRVYTEAVTVDDHMVMKPTEGREVVGVVSSSVRFGQDVVRLEPVAGPATVGGAGTTIAVEDESFQLGWNRPGGGSDC
jgi:hypothetical protein